MTPKIYDFPVEPLFAKAALFQYEKFISHTYEIRAAPQYLDIQMWCSVTKEDPFPYYEENYHDVDPWRNLIQLMNHTVTALTRYYDVFH